MKSRIIRKVFKILALLISIVVLGLLVCMSILAFPGLFFDHQKQYGSISVHTETPVDTEIDSIMAEVMLRLEAVPIYDPAREMDLCLCSTQDQFSFFARFTLRNKRVMGFNLPEVASSYVNEDFIRELRERTGGRPKYHTREGSIVHVATHELMHQILADTLGSFGSRSIPVWKSEGYCEYGVNQFVAPRDSGYSIAERIDIYLDDLQWNAAAQTHRGHYLFGLLMEYLLNVKGLSFEQVMSDEVTRDQAYPEMMAWRESLHGSDPAFH